jgi:hypothetical protein
VTISSPRTPLGCLTAQGTLATEVSPNSYKGVIAGNAVKGPHLPNELGGHHVVAVNGKNGKKGAFT